LAHLAATDDLTAPHPALDAAVAAVVDGAVAGAFVFLAAMALKSIGGFGAELIRRLYR